MGGMFYSLKEVCKKLGKTEEEIKQMVDQGKLRQFPHGPNPLFKIDEVDALGGETDISISEQVEIIPDADDTSELKVAPESQTSVPLEDELIITDKDTEQGSEAGFTNADTIITDLPQADSSKKADSGVFELTDELLEETGLDVPATDEITLADDTSSETQAVSEETIADADTSLGETKADSMEVSLEDIEDDINLDTFGSGSGLLDLSLQADDTSLGGVLDEIYTDNNDAKQDTLGVGSVMDSAAQTEQMLAETLHGDFGAPAPMPIYAEPEPDTVSNALGIMMFLPFMAVIYTGIIIIAGFSNLMPSILKGIQHLMWYILAGVFVVAMLIAAVPMMMGGSSGKTAKKKKPKKKKEKKPKKKKEKKKK